MYKMVGRFDRTGPKSIPCLDKVRQVFVSEDLNSNVYVQVVPNKSHSQELSKLLL